MPDSTIAGVITAAATVTGGAITAGATIVVALILRKTGRLEGKVDQVHVLVDGANTKLQEVVIAQQQTIIALELAMQKQGIPLPETPATTGEPIVATALITDEEPPPRVPTCPHCARPPNVPHAPWCPSFTSAVS